MPNTKKYLDKVGLQSVANNVNTRLKTVTVMPITASEGGNTHVLWNFYSII